MRKRIALTVALLLLVSFAAPSQLAASSAGEVTILASGPPLNWPRDAAVSPDGTTLYILDAGGMLFSMLVNGGALTPIPASPLADGWAEMDISSDGTTLFIGNRGGFPRAIYRLPVLGGTLTPIPASLPDWMHNIDLSQDETVFYIADRGSFEGGTGAILTLPVSGGTATIIVSGAPFVDPFGITVSPDGSTLYIADGSGVIFSLPAAGGIPTVLASGAPLVRPVGIVVSPDGNRLYITDESLPGVLSVPTAGGAPTILASGSPFVNPQFLTISPDGSKLFVTDRAGMVLSISTEASGGVTVTAQAPTAAPELTFSITPGIAPEGGSVTGSSIDFGALAASTPKTGSQRLSVSTNAANGYNVTTEEDHPLQSGTNTIPDVAGDDSTITEVVAGPWTLATTYGFGYTLANVSGTDAAFTSGFKQFADKAASEIEQAVMSNVGPVTNSQTDVTYKLNIGPSQPAGIYSNTVTYIATGNF